MGKTLSELHELLDVICHLKGKSAVSKSAATREKLRLKISDGANDLIASSVQLLAQGAGERAAELRRIRSSAEALRAWARRGGCRRHLSQPKTF
jgi:hypothetical protein